MEVQAIKGRKTRNEMVHNIIMESVATEQNVLSIQKHFSESLLSMPQSNPPCSEIANSLHNADEIVSVCSECSGEKILEYTDMEQTLQYMEKALNEWDLVKLNHLLGLSKFLMLRIVAVITRVQGMYCY